MSPSSAIQLWNELAATTIGNESYQATPLGVVALSHDVPLIAIYRKDQPPHETAQKVAGFLLTWAKALMQQDNLVEEIK